jgi:uncharacterized protein
MRPPINEPQLDFRGSRRFILRIAALLFLLLAALQSISFYVETLWYGSLGFESVYWSRLRTQAIIFFATAILTTLVLRLIFRLVAPPPGFSRRPFLQFGQESIALPPASTLTAFAWPASILLGIVFGLGFSADWARLALFINRVPSDGPADPIFGQSISFYLFTLPVLEAVAGWFLAICIIGLVAAMILSATDMLASFRGVSLAVCLLLFAGAFRLYVGRYSLLAQDHGLFTGVRYVDHNIVIPGLLFVIAALLLGAAVAAANVRLARVRNLALAIGIPAVTYIVAGVIAPLYVTTFVVRPNELVRETPYIKNNIEFTRRAFALDDVEEIPFEPRLTNAVFDPAKHDETLDNLRLWDWRALQSTLRQIQEIRTYYDFVDIDVDRYVIAGKPRAVMVGTRELSLNKLQAASQNWVNQRLIYTHGYGVTMNTVDQFTKEGLPQLVLSNMPVESTDPGIQVKRPEVYYGEITNWPVYVKTTQKEFNYPEGDANSYNTYEGGGGIQMGSFFRRLLIAWTVGDIMKVPFSDDITADSLLLMRRNIAERVTELAPFLTFDPDPYIVVGTDGSLYWMIDAFTTSDRYPYARQLSAGRGRFNYIRNSVKAVVNAYNGEVRFYVFDDEDPLIQSYRKIFPQLFTDGDQMPGFLRDHIRYPELLFRAQAAIYSMYHVENEQVFYNREDIWTIAQQGRSQQGQGSADAIESFFVLTRFPTETELEFVSILPFTPANRNNLIGWIAGRSDGDKYGKLRAYRFPKTRFVDGPLQIQARIDQDPQLSSQLTLWNQQGSNVIRGNLIVMPLDDVLLFVEPIYLQAERSPMPELRLVILATQDRLVYAPRFPEALNLLLRGEAGTMSPATAAEVAARGQPEAATGGPPAAPAEIRALVDRANRAFEDYRRLTSEGKLGEAGAKLDELKRALEELRR